MSQMFQDLISMIGNTPIVKLNKVTKQFPQHEFYAKLESFNPGGSVKDRLGLALIEGAEKRGELKPGGTIVEATSGNTGLGLALISAIRGYKCIFVMPDKISEEKRAILRAYGAKVVITPTAVEPEDPRSYLSVARKIVENTPNCFYANQYHNPDNTEMHYRTTGPEIWRQTDGQLDAIVGGMGTGGTLSGCGKYLREKKKDLQVVCADPVGSILYDLFYNGKIVDPPAPYKVEGVGEDMLPENVHLKVMTAFERVSDKESFEMTRKLIEQEAMCVGPSSAMALVGAMKFAAKQTKPMKILTIFPDNGRAYLSKAFNDKWMSENGFVQIDDLDKVFNRVLMVEDYYKEMGWKL